MPSALPLGSRSPARGHDPVLADEVCRLLSPRAGETVVDCTFGAGGHARRIAPALGEGGRYVAIDRDPEARDWFDAFADDVVCETRFVAGNFADVLPRLADQGLRADVVLMDLGLSSMQVDRPERGFSYSRQAPLDMRMDPTRGRSAADLVADASESELAAILRDLGCNMLQGYAFAAPMSAEALSGLTEGRAWRVRTRSEGLEPAEDLAVAVATEQAQRDDEPDQEPTRQPGADGPVPAGTGEDFFYPGAGDDTFQGAGSLARGPRRESVDLLADVDHRSLLTSHGVVANSCWSEAFGLATPVGRYWG